MSTANPAGRPSLRIVETIDSTTAELLRRPLHEVPPGSALLALSQTGGRGRSDRVWESSPGGMYLSVVLRLGEPAALSLLGAMALVRLLEGYGLVAGLRWPNDVMLGGRKVGGVLPVARYQGNTLERAVLGVGLNVAQPTETFPLELRAHITTLALESPQKSWDVPQLAEQYLQAMEEELDALEKGGLARLCRRCEPFLEGLGDGRQPVLVQPDQPPRSLPTILGLAADGALLLANGQVLSALGRDQRLRFSDEI